jgi:pimeloyl-ACP methyl ester carboxylesterase
MIRATSLLILLCMLVTLALPVSPVADDPFIPAGATRIDIKIREAKGFLFKPTAGSVDSDQPWVWYAPTMLGGPAPKGVYPNASTHWLFTKLLARGIWIAGVDVGESYGSPAGRSVYTQFYKTVSSRYHLSKKPCFLAQSRGGLMSFGWAAEHPGHVRCIAAIYPVLNLSSWPPQGSPLLGEAAKAYGYASVSEFQKQSIQLSPLSHAGPLVKAKIPVFILHGDFDRVVPAKENSQPFVTTYTGLGGAAELIVVPGKGHEEVDEYFKSDRLVEFLLHQLVNATPQ